MRNPILPEFPAEAYLLEQGGHGARAINEHTCYCTGTWYCKRRFFACMTIGKLQCAIPVVAVDSVVLYVEDTNEALKS
jgi:hypothetical protein